jgi:hypothetical protein
MATMRGAELVTPGQGRLAKKSKIKLALLQKKGIVTGLLLHVSP